MATAVTVYRANDGTQFSSLALAELHDSACNVIDHAMSGLVPRTAELEANKGYLQQSVFRLSALASSSTTRGCFVTWPSCRSEI